jgi:hypothetical protein
MISRERLHGQIGIGSSDVDRIYLMTDLYKAHMREALRERGRK